jgi:SanA protein
VAVTAAANAWVHHVAAPFVAHAPSDVRVPVAIVPGASVHRDGAPSPQLEARLALALLLARQNRVEGVLVSGARNGAYDEAGPMRRWLIQRGVPAARISDDHAGYRTLDTMERALRVYRVRRAVICTQSFHLPRAIFLARRAGIDAVGLAPDSAAPQRSPGDLVREVAATLVAVLDSYVLGRQPRQPGPTPAPH